MRWLSVMSLAKFARSNVDHQLSPNGRSGRDREAGAVAMIVAMLFGFGVLLGLGALVIDTGSLLYERRQLQNGADAAALAVGKECAGNPACAPDKFALSPSSLTVLAGANASDTLTTIESICGNLIARTANLGLTETCPTTSTGKLVDCPLPVPSTFESAPFIEVRTATNTGATSNPSILPPILAQTLVGGGYSGETVRACARVAWLPAGEPTGPVLPVAFSACSWADATGFKPGPTPSDPPAHKADYELPPTPGVYPGYGTSYEVAAYAAANPLAPQMPLWPTKEVVLYNQGQDAPGSCTTWNNHVAPGTFGELPQTDCNAIITERWAKGDPSTNGNSTPCSTTLLKGLKGHVVNVPIFDCYTATKDNFTDCSATGPGNWYHIAGYASFYLTGFYFSSGASDGYSIFPLDGTDYQPCKKAGDRCISGWFTTGDLPAKPAKTGEMSFGTFTPLFAG